MFRGLRLAVTRVGSRFAAKLFVASVEEISPMERRNKHTLSARTRCELLIAAQHQAIVGVAAPLKRAEAPRAYAAYKRFLRSIDLTLRHAMRQRMREED